MDKTYRKATTIVDRLVRVHPTMTTTNPGRIYGILLEPKSIHQKDHSGTTKQNIE
jgi:hypothetical protein